MKLVRKLTLSASLAVVAALGHAPAYAASPFPTTTLESVIVHDFGNQILLSLPAPVTNAEGCASNNFLVVEKTNPFFREIFDASLSVFQANGKVSGWVHGCNATFRAPVLIRLDLVR